MRGEWSIAFRIGHVGGSVFVSVRGVVHALLRVSGSSIEWNYLNSGTHDSQRNHEFDRAAVSTIVAAALAMDRGLEAIRNG